MKKYLETPEAVIKALRDGKEIFDNLNNKYKLIDGFVMSINQDGGWGINSYVGGDIDALYIEEPKPFKLEVGKFYKTRDGRKAAVTYLSTVCEDPRPVCVALIGTTKMYWVRTDGLKSNESGVLDLVAPWEE